MIPSLPLALFSVPAVAGLDDRRMFTLTQLLDQWSAKRARNAVRQGYVDMKQGIDVLGVSIPDYLKNELNIVMGWPGKAVSALADRVLWDGVVYEGAESDPFGLDDILAVNRFDLEVHQATESALTQSLAFWATIPQGEGNIPLVRAFPAEWATALWDWGRREIVAGLTITQSSIGGVPEIMNLFLPGEIIELQVDDDGVWSVTDYKRVPDGVVAVKHYPYNPSLQRPFGRSRVNRQVMSLTDRAIRTAMRDDVSSEFYMAPFYILLGADESTFQDPSGHPIPMWDWVMGNVKAISRDEDGNVPEVFQSRQLSMDPYIAQLRQLAAEFAGATSIPVSALGIVQDNPSSAEAIYAAKEDLVIAATNANRVFGYTLNSVYVDALMIRDGSTDNYLDYLKIGTKWRNPAMPSVVSQSDAMVKQIAAIPWLADTKVALEELGYTDSQITRLEAEKRKAEGGGLLDRMARLETPDRLQIDDLGQVIS